jgi:hypothetical protein
MARRKRTLVDCKYGVGVLDDGVENLRSSNGDGKASSVESADGAQGSRVRPLVVVVRALEALLSVVWSVTERRLDVVALARVRAIAGKYSDGNHAAHAEHVHDEGEEREEGLAAEAACEDDRKDGVQDNCARDTLDGLLPAGNAIVAVGLHGEEVAVDTKDDTGAAESEAVDEGCAQAQGSAADSHYV